MMSLIALKLPKTFLLMSLVGETFAGAYFGLYPTWILVLASFGIAIVIGTDALQLFRGSSASLGNDTPFQKVASEWITDLYERQQLKQEAKPQTWNCRNCGGPNVEQITCQYCGSVKE
jgi:hypothetical protein